MKNKNKLIFSLVLGLIVVATAVVAGHKLRQFMTPDSYEESEEWQKYCGY